MTLGRKFLAFRMGTHFGVFAWCFFSLWLCFPYVGGGLPAAYAQVAPDAQEPTHGEISRRLETLEAVGSAARFAALEARVAANTTMLWASLGGLAMLVLETFGRLAFVLVQRMQGGSDG